MANSTPLQFDVPDMDCDACVASITKAVQRVDPKASVSADLHQMAIQSIFPRIARVTKCAEISFATR